MSAEYIGGWLGSFMEDDDTDWDYVASKLVESLTDDGHAVVELPTRGKDAKWHVGDDDFTVSLMHLVRTSDNSGHTGVRISWGSFEFNLGPEDAAGLGRALLAAMQVAQQ